MEEMREVADGLRFPEGPVAVADGSVLVTEIAGGAVARCMPDGTVTSVASTGGGPNGAAIGPDGALYVCNNGGTEHYVVESRGWLVPGLQSPEYIGGRIQRVDISTGAVSDLYTECGGRQLRGPNDIVFDASGGFWFTDHGKTRAFDVDRGALYYASAFGGHIKCVVPELEAPNGIGLSPDGTRLYVAETMVGRIWAWEVVEPGVVTTKRHRPASGAELVVGLPGYQLLDSLAVDSAGDICVATIGDAPGITVVTPDGEVIEHVDLPDPIPTNICFGGNDLRTAYITLSASGRVVALPWNVPGLPLAF